MTVMIILLQGEKGITWNLITKDMTLWIPQQQGAANCSSSLYAPVKKYGVFACNVYLYYLWAVLILPMLYLYYLSCTYTLWAVLIHYVCCVYYLSCICMQCVICYVCCDPFFCLCIKLQAVQHCFWVENMLHSFEMFVGLNSILIQVSSVNSALFRSR